MTTAIATRGRACAPRRWLAVAAAATSSGVALSCVAGLAGAAALGAAETATATQTRTLRLAPADCARLAAKVPVSPAPVSPGEASRLEVSQGRVAPAELTPGRDVAGRPVAPADLPTPAAQGGADEADATDRADAILAAVEIVVERRRRGPAPGRGDGERVEIGVLAFDGSGRLLLNGRPLSGSARARLEAACGDAKDR